MQLGVSLEHCFLHNVCSHQYVALLVDVRFIVPSEAEVCTRLGMDVMGGD